MSFSLLSTMPAGLVAVSVFLVTSLHMIWFRFEIKIDEISIVLEELSRKFILVLSVLVIYL